MLKVLEVMLNEEGYVEKKTDSQLENKKANPGKNNYTKYGKTMGCQGQPWCDATVDWSFLTAYGKEKAKKLLGGFSNYTPTSAQYYKNMKRWYTSPQTGDQIFFKNSERICHTGLVYEVKDGKVYTIEGNTTHSDKNIVVRDGGCVARKVYDLANPRIAGYGRPDYLNITGENVLKNSGVEVKINSIENEITEGNKVYCLVNLNVRSDSSTKGKILTTLNKGHRFTIKKIEKGWGKITVIKNKKTYTGWVNLKYVKKVGNS